MSIRAGNTGDAREIFLEFLAVFVNVAFGKFGVDYFPGVSGPESRPTFFESFERKSAGGLGQARPSCELGTHTHALFVRSRFRVVCSAGKFASR